jgi:FkbM family methyltransferase
MKKYIYIFINKLGYKIENRQNSIDKEMSYLSKFKITENLNLLYRARVYVRKIDEFYPDLKIVNHKNGLIFKFSDVSIFVESPEEIFIINEVFVEHEYNFIATQSCILLDIGANVGISSLFFSRLPFVEKVYSFEPVPETYQQAKKNLSLNESINKVVELNNFGLGKNNRSEVFFFNKDMKGNTGVRGLLSPSYAANSNTLSKVEVSIRDVSEVLAQIQQDNKGKKVVVKMDCEGAEYEIFENLVINGRLNNVDVFMIEWHDKGAHDIENVLQMANFNCFSRNLDSNSGMIYAYKN